MSDEEKLIERQLPKKIPFMWQSGCMRIDPRCTVFTCQFVISFFALTLCGIKLYESDSCETQSFYGNILTTLIGLWMPSPLASKSRP